MDFCIILISQRKAMCGYLLLPLNQTKNQTRIHSKNNDQLHKYNKSLIFIQMRLQSVRSKEIEVGFNRNQRRYPFLKLFLGQSTPKNQTIDLNSSQIKLDQKRNAINLKNFKNFKFNDNRQDIEIDEMRSRIEGVVTKFKASHFSPKGASKTKKLDLIKSKRSAQLAKQYKYLSSNRLSDLQTAQSQILSMRNGIATCTLQQSIYYG